MSRKLIYSISSNKPHYQLTFTYNGKEFPIILFSKAELIVYYRERVSEILNIKELLIELNRDLHMATCNNVFVPADAYFFRVNPKTRMMDYILADFDLVEKIPHHLKITYKIQTS